MSAVTLSKVLGRKGGFRQALGSLLAGLGDVAVLDESGALLVGNQQFPEGDRLPVICNGNTVGWVQGGEHVSAAAAMLTFLVNQESEKKSLGSELLDRYRELHLLYHLSERLAVSPLPADIAGVALEEVMNLIQADTGIILLNQPGETGYHSIAVRGIARQILSNCGIIDRVLESRKAELSNSVPGTSYFADMQDVLVSVACAPLKTEDNVLGVVILVGNADRSFTAGELKLLNAVAMHAGPAIEISRLHQVALEKARFEHELKMARGVQESLLPARLPDIPGWRFDCRWRPAREVSGDFYDLIDEGDGQMGLVIADVTGKGMPASLFMVFARSALRASISKNRSPAEAISQANQLICLDSHEGLFATLFYARLNLDTGHLCYVNAGHPLPILLRCATGETLCLRASGLPLGVDEGAIYDEHSMQMLPEDFLIFYTDGVTEAFDAHWNEFGEARLEQVIRENHSVDPVQVLNAVEEAVENHTGGGKAADDITLLMVQRSP